jgi:primosomal replication protein N
MNIIEGKKNNNIVNVVGKIISSAEINHTTFSESFYYFAIEVPRLSGSADKLIILVSEREVNPNSLQIGKYIKVNGQLRSYNNGSRLHLNIFAKDIEFLSSIDNTDENNQIFLNGFICKSPIYRTTPFGREIGDLLIAVNRQFNKSDYIPSIVWGRNAKFCEGLSVGTKMKLWGRVQSREYKKVFDGETVIKIAYEVSISKMEV